ncbi:unnamed protein product [Nippostrongylus brasiliensis]|uniref:Uncharacterized protein n=1 Tax=Nippostrongylus brasiliensis TaxID=27835 RepID=A0A0N4Y761_NIPBR|nr:unnamed protein product [Nippostrongylus brasiliensis]
MQSTILLLLVFTVLSAAYQAPQGYGQPPPKPFYDDFQPAKFIPAWFPPFYSSSSSSEGKRCGRCRELRSSCRDYEGDGQCEEAKIINFTDKHGCKKAVIYCRNSSKQTVLETDKGEKLAEGTNFEKTAKCLKSKRWNIKNMENDDVKIRNVRCVTKKNTSQHGSKYI